MDNLNLVLVLLEQFLLLLLVSNLRTLLRIGRQLRFLGVHCEVLECVGDMPLETGWLRFIVVLPDIALGERIPSQCLAPEVSVRIDVVEVFGDVLMVDEGNQVPEVHTVLHQTPERSRVISLEPLPERRTQYLASLLLCE